MDKEDKQYNKSKRKNNLQAIWGQEVEGKAESF